MIDIHSHLLPGIDDGSRSPERSVEVLQRMAENGIAAVVLTPHLTCGDMARHGADALEQRAEVFENLRAVAPAAPVLHLGFEIMLDELVPPATFGDRRFALAGSRYVLVEFPLAVAATYAGVVLERISAVGIVPVVAHPERYDACTPEVVAAWRSVGAKIQLDATTFTGPTSRGQRARALLKAGLADVLAADNHGSSRMMTTGRRYLEGCGDHAAAELLTVRNPRAIVEDRDLSPVPRAALRGAVLGIIERMLKG
jgi:protein-tyrosine phosphatase